ncbi:NBS-LRR type resistance protein [Cucumis melo var. makuwa]|uniref:NBS-LRR type resistance protein n=1 Tax=Cucumis melo var. makuwa TaxID=1194695 RepID=A0A5A7TM43_CUCMM|nr:NBS-LRR type resistance protein [Cucumis melo var. makuwa]
MENLSVRRGPHLCDGNSRHLLDTLITQPLHIEQSPLKVCYQLRTSQYMLEKQTLIIVVVPCRTNALKAKFGDTSVLNRIYRVAPQGLHNFQTLACTPEAIRKPDASIWPSRVLPASRRSALTVPLPEKLKKRKGGPVEHTYQSSAPEGCTYQSSAPEGCTYQSSAPEGCTYQSSAPEGCTYQSSAPEGCTHQSSAPEGCTYQ